MLHKKRLNDKTMEERRNEQTYTYTDTKAHTHTHAHGRTANKSIRKRFNRNALRIYLSPSIVQDYPAICDQIN